MNNRTARRCALALALAMVFTLAACSSEAPAAESSTAESSTAETSPADGQLVLEGTMELDYAENFSIDLYEGGYRMIRAGLVDTQYLVVPEGSAVPEGLGEEVTVLQLPLDRVYMSSTGMVSLIDAIGALDHVSLVATKPDRWYIDNVTKQIEAGNIQYSGNIAEPDYELMTQNDIQLHVDNTQIIRTPEVLEKFAELGIPSLVENSSQESSPLGRVEWVKLFGVLFDKEEEANTYFEEQKKQVEEASAVEAPTKTVAMGYLNDDGQCYTRNASDYVAQMVEIAGGDYVLVTEDNGETGTTKVSFEEWYAANKDADYLFYMNFYRKYYSLEEMIADNPLFADFKAVRNGHVWVTSPDFTQSTAAIASIIADMSAIIGSEDGDVTTDHLIKLS